MFTPKEIASLRDMNQRLRTLHIQRAEALERGDETRIDELQAEIDELTEGCDKVINEADAI